MVNVWFSCMYTSRLAQRVHNKSSCEPWVWSLSEDTLIQCALIIVIFRSSSNSRVLVYIRSSYTLYMDQLLFPQLLEILFNEGDVIEEKAGLSRQLRMLLWVGKIHRKRKTQLIYYVLDATCWQMPRRWKSKKWIILENWEEREERPLNSKEDKTKVC